MEGERTTMATDYDSPRKTDDDLTDTQLDEIEHLRRIAATHGISEPARG